jgi:uncharacterized membrane protein
MKKMSKKLPSEYPQGNVSGKIRNTVLLGLLIALVCVFTISIRIPTFTGGYINPGDIIVIFAGFAFGGTRGFIIGSIGSAMADFLGGYVVFIPITILAKGGEGFIAGYIGNNLNRGERFIYLITGGILSALWMVLIYFSGETLLMGSGKAITAIVPNLFQAFIGLTGAIILYNITGKLIKNKVQNS